MRKPIGRRWLLERLEARTLLAVDLTLALGDGDVTVEPGDTLTYTLDYANVGDMDAAGVRIHQAVYHGATFDPNLSSPGWTCAQWMTNSRCALDVGPVAAGGQGTATLAFTVGQSMRLPLRHILGVAVIKDDGASGRDATPHNNRSVQFTPVVQPTVDLQIDLDDGGVDAAPGDTVAYSVNYANTGAVDATGVTIRQVVPAQTTFDANASSAGWTCQQPTNHNGLRTNVNAGSGQATTCTLAIGDLAAGATGSATFAVTVAQDVPPTVREIATHAQISDDHLHGFDPTPQNNVDVERTTVHVPQPPAPDLTLTKDDGGVTAQPGDTVVYTLSYANVGTANATGVVLTEMVPWGTTFDAAASSVGWSCAPAGPPAGANGGNAVGTAAAVCRLDVGSLDAGATGTATFAVTVPSSPPHFLTAIRNAARITDDGAAGRDPTPQNNVGFDMTPIARAHDEVMLTAAHNRLW